MRNVILCGRRPDGGRRDEIWEWCRQRWELTGWEIFEGVHGGDDPFSLAKATNTASRMAGAWDCALIVGGEHFVTRLTQADEATDLAYRIRKLVFAHDHLTLLSEDESDAILAAGSIVSQETRHRNTFSAVLAVPRMIWELVHGFDERFVGWGWEDLAFWSACSAMGGGFERVPGEAYHLWHPSNRAEKEEAPTHPANQVLGERYLKARGHPARMRQIIRERLQLEQVDIYSGGDDG